MNYLKQKHAMLYQLIVKCGNGTQVRLRTIIKHPVCSHPCENLSEQQSCLFSCCPVNCVYGQWENWSNCSNECGAGLKL